MNGSDVMHRGLEGFEGRLLPVLLEAVDERALAVERRRRPRRRTVVRAGALAVAALVGAVIAANTLAVGTDTIQVSAADAVRDPAAVEQQLRDQGVEATILVVPVPDVVANAWWHLYFAPGAAVSCQDWVRLMAQVGTGENPSCFSPEVYDKLIDHGNGVRHMPVLDIPKDVHGPMTLVAGRATEPGEETGWPSLGGELSPDGAFYCLGLERMDPAVAGQALTDLGYDVRWHYNPQPFAGVGVDPGDRYVDAPPEGSALVDVWLFTPDRVIVELVPAELADAARPQYGTPTSDWTPPSWAPSCP